MRKETLKAQVAFGENMKGYAHTNSRGKTYYLHANGRLFYFASAEKGSIDIPPGYKVVESEKTGLPLLKKME